MVTFNKTPLGETGCQGIVYPLLTGAKASSFFYSLCSNLVTYRMPCHAISLLSPKEAEDFSGGGNHPKHVPLPTYLAWLQPIFDSSKLIFNHTKIKNILLVVKSLIKSDLLDM